MNASVSAPSRVLCDSGGTGGVLVGAMGMLLMGLGSLMSAASMLSLLAESGAGVGGLKKTWLALDEPALGCRLDARSEVGAGDMDPCSMLRRSEGLAICSADCSDWAFCLPLAMGGPRLLTVDQRIREVLRQ
jgi:hypothetical protein